MKKELVKLANHLDNIGHRDLADRLDGVLKTAFNPSSIFEAAKQISSSDEPRDENGDISIHSDHQAAWDSYIKLRQETDTRPMEEGEDEQLTNWEVEHPHFLTKYEEEYEAEDPPEDPLVEPEAQESGTFLSYKGDAGSIDPQTIPPLQQAEGGSVELTEGSPAFDGVIAANSAEDRINKLAALMAGEFSTRTIGTFSR